MLFKIIWAFVTRQRLIALQDTDGEVTWTFAFWTPFGWQAKRYWPFNIRNVSLLPGGKCSGVSYVREWWCKTPLYSAPNEQDSGNGG